MTGDAAIEPGARREEASASRLASEFWVAARLTGALLCLASVLYPLLVWSVANVGFRHQAGGSLIRSADGRIVGSELLGQAFTRPEYFHGRPSAAAYDAAASTGSNIGPSNPQLLSGNGGSYGGVVHFTATYRLENGLPADAGVPNDAATASGSGLDPHISPANAEVQLGRVAATRGPLLSEALVRALVRAYTSGRTFGMLGDPRVNVLRLNLALDSVSASARSKP